MFSGKLVKKARQERCLKAYYVARKANISTWYLSVIENGRRSPSLKTLQAIAGAIGTDVTDFFYHPM
ncbi:MAG TPA: helix-turn-helix transcriptional regulator [Desulfitobacteriaceae bacterium]|nr:helix-turn-helix transcriptional regulator [Desulfitobacteriaceae bacterium]